MNHDDELAITSPLDGSIIAAIFHIYCVCDALDLD